MNIKHPDVTVRLSGEDGNAFFIIAKVIRAMRKAGISKEEIFSFEKEAMSGDYDKVLSTCCEYVSVE